MKTLLFAVALTALAPLPVLAQEAENARTYLVQAREAFKEYEKEDAAALEAPTGEAAKRAVEENAAVFPLVERAVSLPLSYGVSPKALFSAQYKATKNVRSLARLLALRAEVQQEAGDSAAAMRSALLCASLGLKLQEDGGTSSAIAGYTVEGIGLGAVEKLAPKWDAATLKAAARGLGEAEGKRASFVRLLNAEREELQDLWRGIFKQQALAVRGYDEPTQERLLAALREVADRDEEVLSRPFSAIRELHIIQREEQGREADPPDDILPLVDANFDARAWAESYQRNGSALKLLLFFRRTRAQAQEALLQTALAARAYRLERGAFLANLQVLVPEYLPAVPGDPFDVGAPLQLKSDAEGIKIYSIGPDGFDDGGQPSADKKAGLQSAGDMPAPATLLAF